MVDRTKEFKMDSLPSIGNNNTNNSLMINNGINGLAGGLQPLQNNHFNRSEMQVIIRYGGGGNQGLGQDRKNANEEGRCA